MVCPANLGSMYQYGIKFYGFASNAAVPFAGAAAECIAAGAEFAEVTNPTDLQYITQFSSESKNWIG